MSWSALDDLYRKPEEEEPTWGDYGKVIGSSTAGIAAGGAGLLRHMFEAGQHPNAAGVFRSLQGAARSVGEDIEGSMTPEARERLAAGVTSEKFWQHPGSSLALKVTGMTPYLLGGIGPGLLARGAGAIGALTASGGASGWLAAGDVADEITKKPDQMSMEDLRKESPLFAGFLDSGDSEREARDKLNQIMMGAKPAIAFFLGAATGVAGPAGNVVRGAAGAGRQGIRRGALEGGITEFAEESYGGIAAQKSEIEGGLRKDYDQSEILDRGLTGMVLGAGFGGVSGIGAGRGKGKAKADEIREAQEQRRGEESAAVQIPDREAGVAIPAEDAAAARGKAPKTEGITVDPAIAAALAAEQPAAPKVEPVVPTPAPPTPPPAPASAAAPAAAPVPVPSPPTPGVAQAQQAPIGPPTGPAALPPGVTAPPPAAPLQQPAPVTAAPATPAASVQPAIPTPQPSAAAPVPPAPGLSTGEPSGVAPAATAPAAVPGPAPTGRVLQDISPEGQQKVAATTAAFQQAGQKGKEALKKAQKAEAGVVDKGKKADRVVKAQAERTTQAKDIWSDHTSGDDEASKLPIPKTPAEKKALGERLKPMVAALKTKMELREDVAAALPEVKKYYDTKGKGRTKPSDEDDIRWHRSLPKRVGGKVAATGEPRSIHTQYLRELVDVQKILEKGEKLGPKSDNWRRVQNFIAAYNGKAPDLIHMSREEAGQGIAASRRGATAEQGERSQAKKETGGGTPGAVKTTTTEGEAAPGVTLEAEKRAKAIEEFNAAQAKRDAAAAAAKAEMERPIGEKTAEPSAPEQGATAPEISDKLTTPKPPKGKAKAEEIKAKKPAKAAEPAREVQPAKTGAIELHPATGLGSAREQAFTFNSGGQTGTIILEPQDGGKSLYVRWVGNGDPADDKPRLRLGTVAMIRLKAALHAKFPEAKIISGHRISGFRGGGQFVEVPLAPKITEETKPETAPAKSGTVSLKQLPDSDKIDAKPGKRWLETGERQGEGEREYAFNIDGKEGNAIVEGMDGGKYIHVRWVGVGESKDAENTLGPVRTRRLLNALKKEYPNAETIGGARTGGARGSLDKQIDVEVSLKPKSKVTSEVTDHISGMSERARHAALRKWMTVDQINALSVKDQIAFLKDPPPVPEAPVKAPPARPKRTEAEIEAEERAREDAERVEEIERDEAREQAELREKIAGEEAREIKAREELEKANAPRAPARPAATQAASAEEVAAFAPTSTSKPKVVTDKRAALKAALKAQRDKPGILKMGAMADLDAAGITDEQIDAMTDEELAAIIADLDAIREQNKLGVSWNSDDVNLWETPLHKAHAVYGYNAKAMPTSLNASDVLRQLDLSHLKSAPKYIQDFVRRRLTEVLGNVKIHIANADLMVDATGDPQAPAGYFHPSATGPGYIAIRSDVMNNRREFTHTVIHEALHAALYHKLENSKTFQRQIQILMTALDVHTRDRASRKHAAYALQINKEGKIDYNSLTAMHEFIAETLSNPRLQQMMRAMKLPADFVRELGLPPAKPYTLWGAFTEKVREILRLPPGTHNLLHEALQVIGPRLQAVYSEAAVEGRLVKAGQPQLLRSAADDIHFRSPEAARFRLGQLLRDKASTKKAGYDVEGSDYAYYNAQIRELRAYLKNAEAGQPQLLRRTSMDALQDAAIGRLGDTKINVGAKLAQYKRAVSTAWDLSGRGEHSSLYGTTDPLGKLHELGAKMERAKSAILDKYGGANAVNDLAKAERAHPEAMVKAKAMLFDLSLHDINPEGNNAHLGKDRLMGVQAKNEIARLKAAWNDPALDPVRDTIRNAVKFFKDIHNATSRATIKNIFAEANIHDEALVDRIHRDGLTEADEEAWANTKLLSALNQVRGLKKRQGWYVPFRRYGDYISAAEHELSVPANATKINDNTLQFVDPTPKNGEYGNARARAAVKGYLRSNSHTPQGDKLTPAQVRKVWVDKNNPSEIVEAEDVDAIPAYRVSMQTQHMEMHETEAEAQNSQDDLKAAGLLHSRSHKREEAYRTDVTNIQSAMGAVLRSLEKQQRYIDADSTQKAAMREMFHDLTLGLSGTTSIKNSMRQRRNVAGESRDLGRVTADYAQMTANHLAMLEYRPQFDAVFKEMRAYEKEHESDKDAIRREEVRKEFENRIYGKAGEEANKQRRGFITRALQLTRLSFLAGPSFHLINMHEVITTAFPYIAGRHGFGATLRAIKDAYSLIGSRAALVSGFKDTVKAATNDSGFTDYVKLFKETIDKNKTVGGDLARRLKDVIDYADARNLYSNASMFEMAKYADPTGNILGRTLDRADLMANQVGSAIEAINRTVTLLSAYRPEYKKNGGNHEAAMHYAYSTAMNTMGDYSAWNAAPIFNTKFGRLALQFKKFPQKTYMLLGNIVGGIAKGDPQAMKQFAGLMVTHGMVAGALGMPTEPFKLALLAANAVGATGFTPEDYDYAVRQLMAQLAGQKGGEILSKGLYRGLGIEVSGRMGYDSLLLRGQPKSQKDADLKTFLFDTMAGAPASYMLNQIQGAQAAFKGDWTTAIEKMAPLRTVGDITKAIVGVSDDKKGPSGKTTQEQFTAWEAAVRALGFTPSSAAEMGALRGTQARLSKRLSAERSELINDWIDASGGKKVDAQRAVQAFNIGRPDDEQITQKDLSDAARRRKREKKVTQHGITTSKRTKAIDEQLLSTFNP